MWVQAIQVRLNLKVARWFSLVEMVYWPTIQYVITAGIIFILFFILSPILYSVWFDNFRDMIFVGSPFGERMRTVGDILFGNFMILGYLIPAILIGWGFAEAARTGTQQEQQGYYYE